MSVKSGLERVGFSPAEFAALFGKSQTWGYRQIYAGKVEAITDFGRILIPASEVDKIIGSAARYEGVKKTVRTKEEIQALKPMLLSAWQKYIRKSVEMLSQKAGDRVLLRKMAKNPGLCT